MNYILILLLALPVFASAKPALTGKDAFCATMVCGTYSGDRNGETGTTTTIEISAINSRKGKFVYTVSREGEEDGVWDLTVRLGKDGRFDMTTKDGRAYARGLCEDRICTYGMHPFPNAKGQTWGNSGMLQFKDDSLELLMNVGFPSDFKSFLSVLAKKN